MNTTKSTSNNTCFVDTFPKVYAVGKIDEAKEMFTEALSAIEHELSEAESLRDGIKKKLK